MQVNSIGLAATPSWKKARVGPAFAVSEQRQASESATVAPADLNALLGLQEAGSANAQDRDAERYGESVIEALAELQRALLGGAGPDLARLRMLAERPAAAADPRLAMVLRAIRTRAAVELARHGAAEK